MTFSRETIASIHARIRRYSRSFGCASLMSQTQTGCKGRPTAIVRCSDIRAKSIGSSLSYPSTRIMSWQPVKSGICFGDARFQTALCIPFPMNGTSCIWYMIPGTGAAGAITSGCAVLGRLVQCCGSIVSQSSSCQDGGIRAEHYPLGVVSPEPDAWVQKEGISSGTLFYPDRGLWSSDRVNMLEPNLRRRVPISIDAIAWEGGIFAPVELKHSRGWQGLEIQGASTLNWDRHGEGCSPGPARDQQASDPRVSWSAQLDGRKVDLEWAEPCSEDAEASGSSGGGH
jgi:hypothetical protein